MNQEERIIELYLCIESAYMAVAGDSSADATTSNASKHEPSSPSLPSSSEKYSPTTSNYDVNENSLLA